MNCVCVWGGGGGGGGLLSVKGKGKRSIYIGEGRKGKVGPSVESLLIKW